MKTPQNDVNNSGLNIIIKLDNTALIKNLASEIYLYLNKDNNKNCEVDMNSNKIASIDLIDSPSSTALYKGLSSPIVKGSNK